MLAFLAPGQRVDGILHDRKSFGELDNRDVKVFLETRRFVTEHLNLEFKSGFPRISPGGRFNIEKICEYIVAFLNGIGGFVVYGVADSVQSASTPLESVLVGVSSSPTVEDMGQWATERIHPFPPPIGVRRFMILGKTVVMIRVPRGNARPYAYYDPGTRITKYFQRSAGGIRELKPGEIRDFYRESLTDQATMLLERSGGNLLGLVGVRQWRMALWRCRG